jgi:hypothetical protein
MIAQLLSIQFKKTQFISIIIVLQTTYNLSTIATSHFDWFCTFRIFKLLVLKQTKGI